MTRIRSSVQDEAFLRQLSHIGVLMEFESLLSCHGDELGMLEDMSVGVSDLGTVSFKVIKASNADDVMPVVKGNRLAFGIGRYNLQIDYIHNIDVHSRYTYWAI